MIDNTFVIDAVVHAYNLAPDNQLDTRFGQELSGMLYYGVHTSFQPRGQPQWVMDQQRFLQGPDPDLLAHALFAESQTDVCIYHEVPLFGSFKDGGSPLWVGKELRKRYPGRVLLYGAVSPWQTNVIEVIDRLVDEDKVVGLKLYPMDIIDGEIKSYRLDDEKVIFPILEHAQARGIRSIAIHKAIPFGTVPIDPFLVGDIDGAARAFPNLTIEIVHGGFAFLEETALQVARFPNVVINLEGGSAYLPNAPRKFAELIGTFLFWGGAQRIVWATGCVAVHPRPFIEAFMKLQMPQDLIDDYGFPPLTDEVKRAILGGNIARILGLDLAAMQQTFAHDEFSSKTELAPPWSGTKVAAH